MAHKKGGGSTRNGRDSTSKRLGVKAFAGQEVTAGLMLGRRRGGRGPPRGQVGGGRRATTAPAAAGPPARPPHHRRRAGPAPAPPSAPRAPPVSPQPAAPPRLDVRAPCIARLSRFSHAPTSSLTAGFASRSEVAASLRARRRGDVIGTRTETRLTVPSSASPLVVSRLGGS